VAPIPTVRLTIFCAFCKAADVSATALWITHCPIEVFWVGDYIAKQSSTPVCERESPDYSLKAEFLYRDGVGDTFRVNHLVAAPAEDRD
jgi:hypothetical protein